MKKCPNCGRRLTKTQTTRGGIFCSRACCSRDQMSQEPGKTIRIAAGDRWEKVAPKMTRRKSVDDWEASRLFYEDKQRHRRAQ